MTEKHIVFVAPFFMGQTVKFLSALTREPGAKISLIHQESIRKLDASVAAKLWSAEQIADVFEPQALVKAVKRLEGRTGKKVERLLGILENLQESLAMAREALNLPGVRPDVALGFRDKGVMKDRLRAAGVPCAAASKARSREEARAFTEKFGFPVVVKPPSGAGAKSTFRVPDAEALEEAYSAWPPSTSRPWLLEEFIQGDEYSFDAISLGGKVVWYSVSKYIPGPLKVLETPWIQWCVILPREIEAEEFDGIRNAGPAALEALGVPDGLSHMEWFRREDGRVAISEVGARPPGAQFMTLMSHAHQVDMHRVWARVMIHDECPPLKRQAAVGAVYLRGMGEGPVARIRGLQVAQEAFGRWVVESTLPPLGKGPSSSYEGDGLVIFAHETTAGVIELCGKLMRTLRIERERGS